MQPIKWYNLTKGDRVKHGDEILTFHRVDGSFAQMRDKDGMTRIGQSDEYVLGDDGIHYILTVYGGNLYAISNPNTACRCSLYYKELAQYNDIGNPRIYDFLPPRTYEFRAFIDSLN